MAIVRVTNPAAVQNPVLPGQMVALKLNQAYDESDPIVRAYPWAFAQDNVESATAAPGEKRNTVRG